MLSWPGRVQYGEEEFLAGSFFQILIPQENGLRVIGFISKILATIYDCSTLNPVALQFLDTFLHF